MPSSRSVELFKSFNILLELCTLTFLKCRCQSYLKISIFSWIRRMFSHLIIKTLIIIRLNHFNTSLNPVSHVYPSFRATSARCFSIQNPAHIPAYYMWNNSFSISMTRSFFKVAHLQNIVGVIMMSYFTQKFLRNELNYVKYELSNYCVKLSHRKYMW